MKIKLYKKFNNLKNGDLLLIKDKELNTFTIVQYRESYGDKIIFFIGNEIEEDYNDERSEKLGIIRIEK